MRTLHIATIALITLSCNKKQDPEAIQNEKPADQAVCVSYEVLQSEIQKDPARAAFLEKLEMQTRDYKGRSFENARIAGTLYLPVAIHIVLPDPSIVTDDLIRSQVEVWNKDFNKANVELTSNVYLAGYPLSKVANCQIQFYVTDIIRKATTAEPFDRYGPNMNGMKSEPDGSNPVDPGYKLNVWVSDNLPNSASWGQFPGGNLATDGIVVDYAQFGTINPNWKGRVATHEVGHWLNLRHIWGDNPCGNDYVQDTPEHNGPNNYQCQAPGYRSTCKNKPLWMWMNFMDYTVGSCQYMFTDGQKKRIDATIDYARKGYFSMTKKYPDILP